TSATWRRTRSWRRRASRSSGSAGASWGRGAAGRGACPARSCAIPCDTKGQAGRVRREGSGGAGARGGPGLELVVRLVEEVGELGEVGDGRLRVARDAGLLVVGRARGPQDGPHRGAALVVADAPPVGEGLDDAEAAPAERGQGPGAAARLRHGAAVADLEFEYAVVMPLPAHLHLAGRQGACEPEGVADELAEDGGGVVHDGLEDARVGQFRAEAPARDRDA